MATLTCKTCELVFEGRPNRRYCGPKCKRQAEMVARVRKRQASSAAADLWGEPTDWGGDLQADWGEPTDWTDLPTWEEITATNEPEMGHKGEHR